MNTTEGEHAVRLEQKLTTGAPLTLEDAAEYVGVTVRTIQRMIAGGMKAHKIGKRSVRLYRDDIDAWIRDADRSG